MCGQVGIIFGKKRRRIAEREYLNEVFIRMLLCSEERGPHASGMAWLRIDGDFRLFKRPIRAHRLVRELTFHELMAAVDNQTTFLMGHTRWRTRGCEANSRNNHPICSGITIGTHNGTIYNANYLFRRLGLSCYAEVDSKLLFRLANRFAPDGTIDGRGFRKALRLCRGQMSAVLASRLDPGAITVIKGNKPLSLRYSRKHRAVLYASEPEYIDWGLQIGDCGFEPIAAVRSSSSQISNSKNPHSEIQNPNSAGWRELEIPPLTILTFRHEALKEWQSHPFKFVCQEQRKADL